jgi:LL-diaminopimelate aminotransferase
MKPLREAIAAWYKKRFQVSLDPDREVLPLIGSKEGIAHLPLALVNPGETVLVPDPAYPVYQAAAISAGGDPEAMPLLEENGFLPDLDSIDARLAGRARLIFVNYPNNPTAATADLAFFERLAEFARENGIIVASDAAYTELAFDGYRPPSFLQVRGAKEVGIEFHSLSKTYNMTGWRIGFAVGNREVIDGLSRVKSNIDSGIFRAVQRAGIEALTGPQDFRKKLLELYRGRRDLLVDGLQRLGWEVEKPRATFYLWCPVPSPYNSTSFSELLLQEAGIVTTPGVGLGRYGEGYIRLALTRPEAELREALERLKSLKIFS